MSSVTLTSAMRNNLLSLRRLSLQMGKTQEILSTGKKVNSAIDNASNYYQARSLTNRAADLMELLNSMDQGIRTIEAATVGLEQGAAFLEQATAVATEALTTAKIPAKEWFEARQDVAAVVSDWNELKAALDRGITGNIVIYGQIECEDSITLKDGQNLVGVGYFGDFDTEVDKFSQLNFVNELDQPAFSSVKASGTNIIADLTMRATSRGDNGNLISCSNQMVLSNLDIYHNLKGPSVVVGVIQAIYESADIHMNNLTIHANQENITNQAIVTISNHAKVTLGGKFTVEGNFNQAPLHLSNYTYNDSELNILSSAQIFIKSSVSNNIIRHSKVLYDGNEPNRLNIAAGAVIGFMKNGNAEYYQFASDFVSADKDGFVISKDNIADICDVRSTTKFDKAENEIKNKITEITNYKNLLQGYDELIADSSYQGVNLLTGGKVDVTFNETRSHKFTVAGQDMSAQALGITTLDWQTQGDIAQSLSEIAAALNSIRGFQEELGNHYGIIQTRQDFTEALADVLETGADDLVLADMNEASAEYLTLQTRQYLAVNALSLAAQSSRGILRLF